MEKVGRKEGGLIDGGGGACLCCSKFRGVDSL